MDPQLLNDPILGPILQGMQGQFGGLGPMGSAELSAISPQLMALATQASQAMGIQPQLIGAQTSLADQLAQQRYGFETQNLDLQRQREALAGQRLGLQGQGLDISEGALGRTGGYEQALHSLAQQGFGLTEAQDREQNRRRTEGEMSSATSRGALQTQGTRDALSNINQDLAFQMQGLGQAREREQTGFGYQQGQLSDQQKQLGLQRQGLGISGQELGITNQGLGIQGQELSAQLQNALNQAGINQAQGLYGLGQQVTGLQGQIGGLFGGALQGALGMVANGVQPPPGPQYSTPGTPAPGTQAPHQSPNRVMYGQNR